MNQNLFEVFESRVRYDEQELNAFKAYFKKYAKRMWKNKLMLNHNKMPNNYHDLNIASQIAISDFITVANARFDTDENTHLYYVMNPSIKEIQAKLHRCIKNEQLIDIVASLYRSLMVEYRASLYPVENRKVVTK